MKIDKIKKSGFKYKIVLSNGKVINTYEEVILNNGLLYHSYVSDDLFDKINVETNYYKSYNKVLDMISRKLRSEEEVKLYLEKNDVSEKDINDIITRLKVIGLIDDRKYATAYTNDKINLSSDGPIKIRKNLESNKISDEYINEALSNIDKDIIYNKIDKIINKKVSSNTKYTPSVLKQKILTYLINLGYSREDILYRLNNIEIKKVDTSHEMDKIYNKLSKKYSDKELIYKFKNKLYSKGYSREEIENYIIKE